MLGVATRKLNRDTGERKALFRDLVGALVMHGRVETTLAKAKETKKIADSVVSLAIDGTVDSRRRVRRLIIDPKILGRLFKEVAPKFQKGRGGYTRILRTRARRGDAAEMALVEFVE